MRKGSEQIASEVGSEASAAGVCEVLRAKGAAEG